MDLTQFRNPHIAATAPQEDCGTPAVLDQPMRLRTVTLSPAEEYARRPGLTESIPDALAALILSRKTRVQVTLKGVKIQEGAIKRVYWHPDSPLCNRIGSGETLRVVAVWNRQDPTRIHLLSDDGRYLETLPEQGRAAWFDYENGSKELAGSRRVITRVYDHLQRVHHDDSLDAVERAARNAEEANRVLRATMNFEAPAETVTHRDAAPSRTAESISLGNDRTTHAQARAAVVRREADDRFDRDLIPTFTPRETQPAALYDPFDL